MRFRSFNRGTVSLCRSKGCKTTSCQSSRSEKNPAARSTSNHTSAARIQCPDDIVWESNAGRTRVVRGGPRGRIFFRSPTLTGSSSAALWPTETYSTSLKRSKPLLLTYSLSKSLASLTRHFIFIQNSSTYWVIGWFHSIVAVYQFTTHWYVLKKICLVSS